MDRLQRDEAKRSVLASSWQIFRAAVDDGIVSENGIDLLGICMQELHGEGLIAFRSRNHGTTERPVWDGVEIQQLHDWRVTGGGRRDAKLFRDERERSNPSPIVVLKDQNGQSGEGGERDVYDLFISHAGEDKASVARPLADAMRIRGWATWLDELELTVGDSLTQRIDQALAQSKFGAVILSDSFFSKQWPQRELAGLTALEVQSGTKVILPVWHGVDQEAIAKFSPVLADRVGASTGAGIEQVADQLSRALTLARDRSSGKDAKERVVQAVPTSRSSRVENPDDPGMSNRVAARIALAQVLVDKGDSLAAEAYLREAVEMGDSHAAMLLGMVLKDLGRADESVALLTQSVEAGRMEALTPLGMVLHDLGRLQEAEEVLRRAAANS